jgi:hypothetical protein
VTPYLDCRRARTKLTAMPDGELPMADQVALEAHLRWCATCAARVSDSRLIGTAIRIGARSLRRADESSLSTMRSAVVARVGSEREASLAQRFRDACDDRRLLWPALGGTLALAFGLALALTVLRVTTDERPESLAAMLGTLSTPGSERNPLTPATAPSFGRPVELGKRFENRSSAGVSIPRVLDDAALFAAPASVGPDYLESEYTVAAVVNREGRVANYSVLRSSQRSGAAAAEQGAVQDAVRLSRFEPAQTPTGEAVAVNLIWVIVHQTVKPARQASVVGAVRPHRPLAPVTADPATPLPPSEQRSSTLATSATA